MEQLAKNALKGFNEWNPVKVSYQGLDIALILYLLPLYFHTYVHSL